MIHCSACNRTGLVAAPKRNTKHVLLNLSRTNMCVYHQVSSTAPTMTVDAVYHLYTQTMLSTHTPASDSRALRTQTQWPCAPYHPHVSHCHLPTLGGLPPVLVWSRSHNTTPDQFGLADLFSAVGSAPADRGVVVCKPAGDTVEMKYSRQYSSTSTVECTYPVLPGT